MLQVPARQIAHVQRDGAVARGAHHGRLALQVPRRNLDRDDLQRNGLQYVAMCRTASEMCVALRCNMRQVHRSAD
jgi:hypothetical protein